MGANVTKKNKLLNIDASHEEAVFAAQSIVKGYNDAVNQCAYLDGMIAMFTAQRVALQPQLDAATSLAAKIEAEFPPEVEPPEPPHVVAPPIYVPDEGGDT
jgi:hypothetical protein